MKLDLDRHDLADRAVWQEERFHEAITGAISVLEDTVRNIRAMETRPLKGETSENEFHTDTPGRRASEVVNALTSAFYNCGLPRFTHLASDLEVTLQALVALNALKAAHTAQVQRALDAVEDDRLAAQQQKKREETARRTAREHARCQASVWHNLMARSGQCDRRATSTRTIGTREIRVCRQHAKLPNVEIYKETA